MTTVCHQEKIIWSQFDITKQRNHVLVQRNEKYMNNSNIFVVLSIVAATALFGGAMVTSVLAVSHDNMTMSKDNSTTGMTENATIAIN